MYPAMVDQRSPTSEKALRAFELQQGLALPNSYKDFLLVTNGGIPKEPLFPVSARLNNPFDEVQSFLGIGVSVPTNELSYAQEFYKGSIPPELVPIANQAFGSYVCFDLRNGKERVVFWDHRHFWSTGEWREQDLYHVADSFEEFLGLLRPSES